MRSAPLNTRTLSFSMRSVQKCAPDAANPRSSEWVNIGRPRSEVYSRFRPSINRPYSSITQRCRKLTIIVSEQNLNGAQVGSGFQQVRGPAVA
jgi:hypothetical protein